MLGCLVMALLLEAGVRWRNAAALFSDKISASSRRSRGNGALGNMLEVRLRHSGCGKLTVTAWLPPGPGHVFQLGFLIDLFLKKTG